MNDSELLMTIRNAAKFAFVEYFRPLGVIGAVCFRLCPTRPSLNLAFVVMASGIVVIVLLTLIESAPFLIAVTKALTVTAVVGVLVATLWYRIRTIAIFQDILSILSRSIRWIPFVFLFGSKKNETKKNNKIPKQSHAADNRKKKG